MWERDLQKLIWHSYTCDGKLLLLMGKLQAWRGMELVASRLFVVCVPVCVCEWTLCWTLALCVFIFIRCRVPS